MSETKRGLNTSNADDMDDHDSLTINDPGPSAKRLKQEEEATEETHEVKEEEEIIKPSTSDWLDVPEWNEGQGCPLLELPREILDNIFCVRPELSGRDYVALAGTCKFFRHHMAEDFFKGIYLADQGNRTSRYNSIKPFSRFIPDWREDHPRLVLSWWDYPTEGRRKHSQWVDKDSCRSRPFPHSNGHYVPPGPRSGWTEAQYTIYKEEQASWRLDRRQTRLEGLKAMVNGPRIFPRRPLLDDTGCRASSHGHWGTCTCTSGTIARPAEEVETSSTSELMTSPGTRPADLGSLSPYSSSDSNASDSVVPEPKDPLDSDSSEDEDEFEWLQARGVNPIHDHWPSDSRENITDGLRRECAGIEIAKSRFRLDDRELSTIQSISFSSNHPIGGKLSKPVWLLAALEARAFKLHGGPNAHNAYVAAMEAKEAAEKMKKDEKNRKDKKSRKDRKRRRSAENEATAAATGPQDAPASI